MGTDDGSPPQVMFSGHHDGMRGMADGNCAYIAQSYGASIQEIAIGRDAHEEQRVQAAATDAQVHAERRRT